MSTCYVIRKRGQFLSSKWTIKIICSILRIFESSWYNQLIHSSNILWSLSKFRRKLSYARYGKSTFSRKVLFLQLKYAISERKFSILAKIKPDWFQFWNFSKLHKRKIKLTTTIKSKQNVRERPNIKVSKFSSRRLV